jgi:Tol biopolymer transport system component
MVRYGFVLVSIASWLCAPLLAQTTTRVSVDSAGMEGNGESSYPSISPDGRYVAFRSLASNLVFGDTNATYDIFVHDKELGTTTRVSVSSAGTQGNGYSVGGSISADDRYVTFGSGAPNLVPGDTNGKLDVFLHDMLTGTTTRVSVDSAGTQGDGNSGGSSISADGRYVALLSSSTNLVPGDTNGFSDAFVHDMLTGTTTRVSVSSSGVQGNGDAQNGTWISADGRYVAFDSIAANLVLGDTNGFNDCFVHDILTGATTRTSVDSSGAEGNFGGGLGLMSADGRYVAFSSRSINLVPGDTNGFYDVFLHDMLTGTTRRVSVDPAGTQGNGNSGATSISPDGRYVAFTSTATNLVPGDTNGAQDVFVHDSVGGTTTRVNVDSSGAQVGAPGSWPSISADGRYVAFYSLSAELVPSDTNSLLDVFVHDNGPASAFVSLCFGDGTGGACPCSNTGTANHGCENSAATGGALISASGIASLSSDTVSLTSSGELPTALSIVLQGSSVIAPADFGDGLRCAGGSLKRLYVKHATGGVITAPEMGDPSISARSATLGDPVPLGGTRVYQVYYRDPNLVFCPGGFNATNAMAIAWGS